MTEPDYGDPRVDVIKDVLEAHRPRRVNVDTYRFARQQCECRSGECGSPWEGGSWVTDEDARNGVRHRTNKEEARREHDQHVARRILAALSDMEGSQP